MKERQSLRQRHMLDHIDDYEVASDQWWDKKNPKGSGNEMGSSPQRLHQRRKSIILKMVVKRQMARN